MGGITRFNSLCFCVSGFLWVSVSVQLFLLGLLYNVWFHVTLYFCRRGRVGQRNLTKTSFLFLQDENKKWYATMAHEESSKTRQGGLDDIATNYEKLGRMYQTDHRNNEFNALRLYNSKLNGASFNLL